LFFTVFFLPREKAFEWKNMLWVSAAILGVILCQSRTGFLALCLILLIYFASQLISWKVILWLIVLVASFLIFEVEVGNDYVASLGDTTQVESAKEGRFTQWKKIIHSMNGYWIQGHGPNKDYFTENNIYAESEYFLILFRYGIIGILLWISFFFTLAHKYWSRIREYSVFTWYGLLAIFLFTGLTNSPLHAMKVKMVFAIGLGLALILIDDAKKVPFTDYRSKK
jgi:O-antigen ligase